MMFDFEYECLYDLMIAIIGLLPLFEMNDMIGFHMLGFFMHGFGFLLFKGRYVCVLGMNDVMLYV